MRTITIHAGHNKSGKVACGASDYLDESKEARYIVKEVKKALRGKVKVVDCTVNNGTSQKDVLQKIVKKCNAVKRDMDISIHFNASNHSEKDGKSKGVECWEYENKGYYSVANRICYNISELGFYNRGVKISKSLYFLKNTNKPSLLIEVCFVDDEDDAILYKKKKKKVALAIADAIKKYYGLD